MDDRSNHDHDALEAMEVCRPGSNDISDPALAFLAEELAANPDLSKRYEQLQGLDGKIAEAYKNVPVPVGMADRVLAFLALSQMEEPTGAAEVEAAPEEEPVVPRRRLRGWLLATGGVLATAAAILVMVLTGPHGDRSVTRETLIRAATVQFAGALESGEQGELMDAVSPPAAYPFSSELVRSANIRWREISGFLGNSGVAYDLIQGQTRATLYVVRGVLAGLPTAPAEVESSAATGRQLSVGAWQSNGLLYVLVVDGNPGQYRRFLDITHGPVT